MPTVEFDYLELRSLLKGNPGIDVLRERIPMLGVDMESIDENKIIVEIFPNRPDMLSIEGFARALNGFLGYETGFKNYKSKGIQGEVIVDAAVKWIRPYIACGIVKNISLTDSVIASLMDLQEKIVITHGRKRRKVAIGIHNLDAFAFPLRYTAVDPESISFVPLNFSKKMNLREILREHPTGIKYGEILAGLDRYPIITDKNNEVLSFPPIINSELTKVTKTTKNLFIEITGTEERAVNQALNITITALADRGGEIYGVKIKENDD